MVRFFIWFLIFTLSFSSTFACWAIGLPYEEWTMCYKYIPRYDTSVTTEEAERIQKYGWIISDFLRKKFDLQKKKDYEVLIKLEREIAKRINSKNYNQEVNDALCAISIGIDYIQLVDSQWIEYPTNINNWIVLVEKEKSDKNMVDLYLIHLSSSKVVNKYLWVVKNTAEVYSQCYFCGNEVDNDILSQIENHANSNLDWEEYSLFSSISFAVNDVDYIQYILSLKEESDNTSFLSRSKWWIIGIKDNEQVFSAFWKDLVAYAGGPIVTKIDYIVDDQQLITEYNACWLSMYFQLRNNSSIKPITTNE